MNPDITCRLATIDDIPALEQVGDHLFDKPVKPNRTREFLDDPRHHLVIAVEEEEIVGMATGFHYVHPDKDPVLFINEVGVVDESQSQGIGRTLVRFLIEHGRSIGCNEAWVGTEASNMAARKAYQAAGGTEDPEPFILIEFNE